MPSDDDGASNETSITKVGRLLSEYGLGNEYGAQLEAAWTTEGEKRKSLRDLAEEFNRQLVTVAMRDAGISTLDGEVENMFRLLTDDNVSAGTRIKVRNRLERSGVNVDKLERDFVTYQAIRSYLQNERDAKYEGVSDEDRLERTIESIERLQTRLSSVSESNLNQLRKTDRITLNEYHLFVSVDVLCEHCNSQYTIVELLNRGGCDCNGT
ncbi:rod-determining factor RdfA [Halorarum salinum]|uniref:Uncharacterized protein n=1 Tax=Halorarum salinum TaxID=2743089 RepID=A0A7D5L8M8_9EURY|nr:rod-determining factor RdfA [Halobaculum salinum]QLG60335.1 hypothetical protein HUG12_00605 [Halobaculum salinum]